VPQRLKTPKRICAKIIVGEKKVGVKKGKEMNHKKILTKMNQKTMWMLAAALAGLCLPAWAEGERGQIMTLHGGLRGIFSQERPDFKKLEQAMEALGKGFLETAKQTLKEKEHANLKQAKGAEAGSGPSRSYKELIVNNDGSTTIVEPYFKNPSGEGSLPIGAASIHSGVCKLYGYSFSQMMTWHREESGDLKKHPVTAMIDSDGLFLKFGKEDPYLWGIQTMTD